MRPERWQLISRLYHDALAREADARPAFLREACAGDEALRREVELRLAQAASAEGVFDGPAVAGAAHMVSESSPSILTGRRLGAYQLQALLGRGGMGEVYRARDTRLERDVAIKILARNQVADPERKRRFLQEARAASALNHPNIVTLHDIASDDGVDFLVLEYVRGRPLHDVIPPKGLPLVDVLGWAAETAGALAAAHAAGILHRDIKPANVMVTPDGHVKTAYTQKPLWGSPS
jgi:serine/threonine protein kinase